MRTKIIALLALACNITFICSAINITGRVRNEANSPIADASVMALVNDSIAGMSYTDTKGKFDIKLSLSSEKDSVKLMVEAIGYEPATCDVKTIKTPLEIRLTASSKTVDLDEVVVESDRSQTVKRLANGQRFYLSKEAKAMNDPFMALKEIPVIISDPANSTVKSTDGSDLLVLIDGVEVNSGIKPILPAEIASVDVINMPSARYLARGVKQIINIQLSQDRRPYIWTELATRHEIPWHKGFGVGYFEVGNSKVSLYGRASYNYQHHEDMKGDVFITNTGYAHSNKWHQQSNGHDWLGELLFKYAPTNKDYLAVQLYTTYEHKTSSKNGEGEYVKEDITNPFTHESNYKNRNLVMTGSIYYGHLFTDASKLEVRGYFNDNTNKLDNRGTEHFGEKPYTINSLFDNHRTSGSLYVDYNMTFANGHNLEAGFHSTILNDKIKDGANPIFKHKDINEYLYASYTGMYKKLSYMASLGIDMTWIGTETTKRFIRPRGNASLTYSFNANNSLQAGYTLSNQSPDARQLNPFNVSTDSLVMLVGNTRLEPEMVHDATLDYSYNKKGFYGSLTFGSGNCHNLIQTTGYTNQEGIYVQTFKNSGRFNNIYARLYLSQRVRLENFTGRIYGGTGWRRKFYEGLHPKDEFWYHVGMDAWYKKFYFGLSFGWEPKEYTDISITKQLRPMEAFCQVNYNITPNLYVAVALQGFTGTYKTETITKNGTYTNISTTNFLEKGLRPWILIRWNMRKRAKKKIKIDNVLNSQEKGIQLIQ